MTEEQKIEKLLQPRYKVIADYPGNTRPVGSISIEIETASYFDKYPANFKRLQWWECREPEEMPEYVKFGVSQKVIPVYKWLVLELGEVKFNFRENGNFRFVWEYNNFLPATEQEYTTQHPTNKSKHETDHN